MKRLIKVFAELIGLEVLFEGLKGPFLSQWEGLGVPNSNGTSNSKIFPAKSFEFEAWCEKQL